MLEQVGTTISFYFFYTEDGEADTGLAVTANIRKKELDGSKTTLVTDGACTEWFSGIYYYTLAAGSVASIGDYAGVAHTNDADTDIKDVPALWVIGRPASIATIDGIVDDILLDTGTTGVELSANAVDDVWNELLAGHATVGSSGYTLSQTLTRLLSVLAQLQQYSTLTKYLRSGQIEIKRSTDVSFTIYGLGDLSGRTALYFTAKLMKEKDSALDTGSVLQIEESAGLVYIDKEAAAMPANGSITVVDEVAGTITVELAAEESDKLSPNEFYLFDIKKDNSVVGEGKFLVSTAITRTIT